MKAVMYHNEVLNTVQFRVGKINLVYAIPDKLKYITEISDYEDGFITMQTNYGEEYTDLVALVNNSIFSDSFKTKVEKVLSSLKLSDIKLERG